MKPLLKPLPLLIAAAWGCGGDSGSLEVKRETGPTQPRWVVSDPAEIDGRTEREKSIAAWWKAFEARRAAIEGDPTADLESWFEETLGRVHPDLIGEVRRLPGGKLELLITPEDRKDLRPLTEVLIQRAPGPAVWSIVSHRTALPFEEAVTLLKKRTGRDWSAVRYSAAIAEDHRIDLTFFLRKTDKGIGHGLLATLLLVGERDYDRWVGRVRVALPSEEAGDIRRISGLAGHLAVLIGRIRATLPDQPHNRQTTQQAVEIRRTPPDDGEDLAGTRDVLIATTTYPAMWNAAHSGGLFYSECFSRHGERFCYLKMDVEDVAPTARRTLRSRIGKLLHSGLRTAGIGAVIGTGSGIRHVYVDLATTDLDRASKIIRESLRKEVPKRSWLQFYDTELEAEWFGVHPDAPPPPMPDFGDLD